MFQGLKEKLSGIFQGLGGRGYLKEADVTAALRQIRIALLEADVALSVVKDLIEKIQAEAVGEKLLKSLAPEQMLIKMVHDHLVALLTHADGHDLILKGKRPLTYMMVGLQGSGKTTSAAKLALHLKEKGHKVLLCSVDVYRPAAREQLAQLAAQNNLAITPLEGSDKPLAIAKDALKRAHKEGVDILILDTAGRLQIDAPLMDELDDLKKLLSPTETLFVADAMMGQEALPVAKTFHERLQLTGSILTRTDGDARGGAALSIGAVTGRPLKFVGTGETVRALETFDPVRMAGRILDQGDVVSLVEEVEKVADKAEMEKAALRMQKGLFTLEDMAKQLSQMGRMGSFQNLLGMMPGMSALKGKLPAIDDEAAKKAVAQQLAILRSMTPKERRTPALLGASRKRRIAAGSGTDVPKVNRLLKQFHQMSKMMKQMGGLAKRKGGLPQGFPGGGLPPGAGRGFPFR